MKFITSDFLLESKTAKKLFQNYACSMPIYDYHTHLPPDQIAANYRFKNLTEIWLAGDHYKWRAMRANGIPEKFITGTADDRQKFRAWATTVPFTLRNPLYHWTHMELKKFEIHDRLLDAKTADYIYDHCTEMLQGDDFAAQAILKRENVRAVCTTDDPTDTLQHHRDYAEQPDTFTKMLPTWRAERAFKIEDVDSWNAWIDQLAESSNSDINSYQNLIEALRKRHTFFHDNGCRLSDQSFEAFPAIDCSDHECSKIFDLARNGDSVSLTDAEKFQTSLLYELSSMNHEKGWVQQFHFGVIRNNNTRLFNQLGPDTGFDSMGDRPAARSLRTFLDSLDISNQLAKTIVYNLNPKDSAVVATMLGNYQDGSIPGKMQYGAAWWYLDQLDGMTEQIKVLSNTGLLSRFVGMLTDSRSLLSYSRHEYFRRLLCNILGTDIEKGLLPNELEMVGQLVQNICYNNAVEYFGA